MKTRIPITKAKGTVLVRSMAKACTGGLLALSTRAVSFKMTKMAGVLLTSNNSLAHSLYVLGLYTFATGDTYAGEWLNGEKTGHGTCIPFIVNSL